MADKKEMTTLNASVGADAGQPFKNFDITIIPEHTENINDDFSFGEENSADFDLLLRRMNDPGFMPVVSMEDIYGMVFSVKERIIDGLLRTGVYILAGAPKIGKSFMVAQIAYHVSTGRPSGGILSGKALFYTWLWRTIINDSRSVCSVCLVLTAPQTFTSLSKPRISVRGWKNRLPPL